MLLLKLLILDLDTGYTLFSSFDALFHYLNLSLAQIQILNLILNDPIHYTKLQLLNGLYVPYLMIVRNSILLPGSIQLFEHSFR